MFVRAHVHYGIARARTRGHHPHMRKGTYRRPANKTVLASVKREMAAPRMATSARDQVAVLAAANKSRRKRRLRAAAAA
jgi:hypothetical protein